jgi:hypothetical protein
MTGLIERLHDHNDPRSFETRLEAAAEIERLTAERANRYWEGRYRDEKAENERLRALVEGCAAIAENPGFIQAKDTEWDEGVNYAKRFIAKAIRAALESKP